MTLHTPYRRRGILLGLLLVSSMSQAAPAETPRRRFAVVVGANDGGPGRQLRHARSDAESFAAVLRSLGGVSPGDAEVLLDPWPDDVRHALQHAATQLGQVRAGGPVELIFYYSGHSDEHGLFLRGEQLTYSELRSLLRAAPVQFRITILDSCASGSFTRAKGGSGTAPFLADESSRVTGEAVLTSSSASEASQESDRLKSSFFTHHLLSGLRGAADVSQDGQVTLNEAYQFAFHETLARTERTRAGAQHPAYDMVVAGTGDVVVTDLHGQSAGLTLPAELDGRVFLRDAGGRLVVELRKRAGAPVELRLEPGSYGVTVLDGKGGLVGGVVTLSNALTPLDVHALQPLPAEQNPLRGEEQELSETIHAGERLWSWEAHLVAQDPFAQLLQNGGEARSLPALTVSHFFRPLRNDAETPLDLLRFTQRPSEISLTAGMTPLLAPISPWVSLAGGFFPMQAFGLTGSVGFQRNPKFGTFSVEYSAGVVAYPVEQLRLSAAYTNVFDLQDYALGDPSPQANPSSLLTTTHDVRLNAAWRPLPLFLLEAGGEIALAQYEGSLSGTGVGGSTLDYRVTFGATFFIGRRVSVGVTAFYRSVQAGGLLLSPPNTPSDERNTLWSVGPRVQWYILDWLSVGAGGGPIYFSAPSSPTILTSGSLRLEALARF